MRNPENPKRRITQRVGYWDFGYREMEMSETVINKSAEITKCEMAK
jgi:hypothetical protein